MAKQMRMNQERTFIISRSDSIGDVVLTLPVAGVLRSLYPQSRILFLGSTYTQEVIKACTYIDGFLDWDEWKALPAAECAEKFSETGADTIIHVFPRREIARAARKAGIPTRIGTTNRLYHWLTCNRLVRLSRKNSPDHEAQLNLRLLEPLGAKKRYSLQELGHLYGLSRLAPLHSDIHALLDPVRFNVILHPKSRGSGREWGLDNFGALIKLLPEQQYKIFVTGTAAEGKLLDDLFHLHPTVINLTGRLNLASLISFIAQGDALIAASTGPLHLAAALGINALGIFPPIRPIHPGRWAPLGEHTRVLVKDKVCDDCRKSKDCQCMRDIRPQQVKEALMQLLETYVNAIHNAGKKNIS